MLHRQKSYIQCSLDNARQTPQHKALDLTRGTHQVTTLTYNTQSCSSLKLRRQNTGWSLLTTSSSQPPPQKLTCSLHNTMLMMLVLLYNGIPMTLPNNAPSRACIVLKASKRANINVAKPSSSICAVIYQILQGKWLQSKCGITLYICHSSRT